MPRCVGRDEPGLAPLHELIHRHRSDVLAVERFELLDVEVRGRRVHVLEAPQPGELVERHDLLVSGRRPPQEHQEVLHRLGQVPLVAIQLERYGVATLRQLLPLLVDEQWHVREHRQLAAVERAPEQSRLRRVGQVLLGPDDMADLHVDVVDDVRQEEHRPAVAPHEDEVLDERVLEFGLAPNQVDDGGRPFPWRSEAQRPPLARPETAVATETVVAGPSRALRPGVHDLTCAVAVVGVSVCEEARRRGLVQVRALTLEVRTLVPVHTDPAERALDAVDPLVAVALGVGVFDAQHERAAVLTRVDPVVQSGLGSADVEVTRRRRRKPHAWGARGHVPRLLAPTATPWGATVDSWQSFLA